MSDKWSRAENFYLLSGSPHTIKHPRQDFQSCGKPTIRDTARRDIDAAIVVAFTYQSFWEELRRQGYTVKRGPNVKHTAICPPGGSRNIRLDGLGANYTEEAIKSRLAAVRSGEAPPEPIPPQAPQPSPFLTPGKRYRTRGNFHRPREP